MLCHEASVRFDGVPTLKGLWPDKLTASRQATYYLRRGGGAELSERLSYMCNAYQLLTGRHLPRRIDVAL